VFQRPAARYGLAVITVLIAHSLVALGNLLVSSPPLILFAAAVAVTFTLAGRAAGLFALLLATLLSDFFFVRPTFVFSLDRQVFRLSLLYLLGALLSAFISRRLTSTSAAS
jgi:K+-sensing histidine kinase KdpD